MKFERVTFGIVLSVLFWTSAAFASAPKNYPYVCTADNAGNPSKIGITLSKHDWLGGNALTNWDVIARDLNKTGAAGGGSWRAAGDASSSTDQRGGSAVTCYNNSRYPHAGLEVLPSGTVTWEICLDQSLLSFAEQGRAYYTIRISGIAASDVRIDTDYSCALKR